MQVLKVILDWVLFHLFYFVQKNGPKLVFPLLPQHFWHGVGVSSSLFSASIFLPLF
jgi:hypothetical protein